MIRYEQSQYQVKIAELEGLQSQLEQHLSNMENLKEQMFQFWNDPNAREAGEVLTILVRQVRNAMDRTTDMLAFYRSTTEKLGGVGGIATNLLSEAISILSGAGI